MEGGAMRIGCVVHAFCVTMIALGVPGPLTLLVWTARVASGHISAHHWVEFVPSVSLTI